MVAVGIDVSKGKSMLAAISESSIVVAPVEFVHTSVGLKMLTETILSFDTTVKVVMEATGHYHEPVVKALYSAGIFVSVVNPLLIYAYGDNSVRRVKTDKKDAVKIARYCFDNWHTLEPYISPESVRGHLKLYSRQYHSCQKTVHALENNLQTLLDKTFPGTGTFFASGKKKNGRQKWVDFALHFWHVEKVASLGLEAFDAQYLKWCKNYLYRYSKEKAEIIFKTAAIGFATLAATKETELLIVSATKQVIAMAEILLQLKAELIRLVKLLPEYDTVINMYGVGELTAAHLISEIGDIKRFYDGKALVAFAGIDPLPVQSGTYNKKNRETSKRGSATLRKVLFHVVLAHLRLKPQEEPVYTFLNKKKAEGKPYFVYMTAAANKFLRIYYGKVRDACCNEQES